MTRLDTAHHLLAIILAFTRMLWLAMLIGLLLILADWTVQFDRLPRLALDGLLVAVVVVTGVVTFALLYRARSRNRMLLRLIEEHHPDFHNTLVNAADFEDILDENGSPSVSADLMKLEIALAENQLEGLPGFGDLRPPTARKEGGAILVLLAAGFLFAVLGAAPFWTIVPRFLFPFADFPPYCATRFEVEPPGALLDYGENLKVTVTASGAIPKDVSLVMRKAEGGEDVEAPMFDAGDGVFFQTIENVREEMEYFAQIERGRSKRYRLALTKLPRIETGMVTYAYPEYTGLPGATHTLEEGVISAYVGTKVTVELSSNRPLAGGVLEVCGQEYAFQTTESHVAEAVFTLEDAGEYEASVTDVEGNRSQETLAGKVAIVPDEKPEVTISSPGMDSFAVPDTEIPIVIDAQDDLGVAKVTLFRNLNASDDERKTLYRADGAQTVVEAIETLDLKDLGVRPGDVIEYYATATDNNPDKPQTVASESFRLQIISFEAYREFMQTQMTATDLKEKYEDYLEQLERLVETQERIQSETERIEHEVAESGELSTENKERLEETRRDQARLAEAAKDLKKELEEQADTPEIFDIEKDYKEALREFAARLGESGEHMRQAEQELAKSGQGESESAPQDAASRLEAAGEEQQQALDALRQNVEEFREGIQQANENLEKVADLMADLEEFKYLYTLQKGLERQTRYYKEMTNPDLDDKIRLKELSEQQEEVRAALMEFQEKLRLHADALEKLAESEAAESEIPESGDLSGDEEEISAETSP